MSTTFRPTPSSRTSPTASRTELRSPTGLSSPRPARTANSRPNRTTSGTSVPRRSFGRSRRKSPSASTASPRSTVVASAAPPATASPVTTRQPEAKRSSAPRCSSSKRKISSRPPRGRVAVSPLMDEASSTTPQTTFSPTSTDRNSNATRRRLYRCDRPTGAHAFGRTAISPT